MNALAQDIRRICQELLPDCQFEGWGNVKHLRGFRIQVNPAGLRMGSWIQVSVSLKNAPSGTPVPFFRELDRDGWVRDERGGHQFSRVLPEAWLRGSIQEALDWVQSQGAEKPEPPPGPADFLFQDEE